MFALLTLCHPPPKQVLDVLSLSRATLRKIQQNMWWAAGYNLVGIPLAAGALLPLTGLALTPSLSGACAPCSEGSRGVPDCPLSPAALPCRLSCRLCLPTCSLALVTA
jgi:hypothetical protein